MGGLRKRDLSCSDRRAWRAVMGGDVGASGRLGCLHRSADPSVVHSVHLDQKRTERAGEKEP